MRLEEHEKDKLLTGDFLFYWKREERWDSIPEVAEKKTKENPSLIANGPN